jgi:hypothetical protein
MLVGIVVGLAFAGSASATLLGNPVSFPLLSFDNGGILNYDAAADTFQVAANPIAIRMSPGSTPRFVTPNPPSAGEFFDINISVDSSGNLIGGSVGDDLAVSGFIDLDGDGTIDVGGTLLTGEITGFGFQENGATDLYDFSFNVTGGQLANAFGGTVGVSMQSERSTFTGSFQDNFHGGAKGTLGTIPEPTTLVLLGSGVMGLALAGRRREA